MKKAFALKYPQGVEAPIIIAKGSGKKAEKILQIAKENNILIEENEILVDMLGLSNEGDLVPEECWEILAKIFSIILEFKKE
ncbi:MAG: EscU/YscU/HrcU family type III secretion system export apparatus switch protein [Treponema sp.]|nr:EscU/YscU/HrcU family type III secretion system export apparatus switch protein [Treponema sp.]